MGAEAEARPEASDTCATDREEGAGFAAASIRQTGQTLREVRAAIGPEVLRVGEVGVVDADGADRGTNGIGHSRTALRAKGLHLIEVRAGCKPGDGSGGDFGVGRSDRRER